MIKSFLTITAQSCESTEKGKVTFCYLCASTVSKLQYRSIDKDKFFLKIIFFHTEKQFEFNGNRNCLMEKMRILRFYF